MIDLKRNINEFQTQDIQIPMDEYKIFKIECNRLEKSQLPVGASGPKQIIKFERIDPRNPNIDDLMSEHKFKIAGVMMPRDLENFKKIENLMLINKNDLSLEQEFFECLKKCICLEMVQIKDFNPG